MDDGGFIRFDLESEKGTIFVTRSVLHWKGGMPEVDYTERYPAGEWKYSQNGYLFFRKEVPAGYDGSQGYTAIRVEPLDEKCREWNRKYILPIGYGANDPFRMLSASLPPVGLRPYLRPQLPLRRLPHPCPHPHNPLLSCIRPFFRYFHTPIRPAPKSLRQKQR